MGRRIASESKQTVRGGPKPAKVGLHRRLPDCQIQLIYILAKFFGDLPPRQKNFGHCTILGVKNFFRTSQKFSLHKKNFPGITKFSPFTNFFFLNPKIWYNSLKFLSI